MKRIIFPIILSIFLVFSQILPVLAENVNSKDNRIDFEATGEIDEVNNIGKENQVINVSDNTIASVDEKFELCKDSDELSNESAGNSISGATKISTGTTISGSITSSNTADYYRFEISSSGRVALTATAGMYGINYYIYDSTGNQLWNTLPIWNSTSNISNISEFLDLTKGTYYFAVKQYGNYTGSYSFKIEFSSTNESFIETGNGNNNTIATANNISLATNYNGQIALNDDKDFYQFAMPSSGRIVVSATAGMYGINYYIYDSTGNQLWNILPIWNNASNVSNISESIDITEGTYYFAVKQYGNYTGSYSFKIEFSSTNESFIETGNGNNNTIATANNISLATNYNGQIALNDDKDFYKFAMSSSGRIVVSATAGMYGINYYIYDSSGNQLWNILPIWNNVSNVSNVSESIDITEGTYYFVVRKYGNYTGNYSFKIDTHTHNYIDVVTKATTSENGKIVKTCSCGLTNGTTIIYYPKTIVFSDKSFIYDGKTKTPSVKVLGSDGATISPVNYTLSFSNERKNVGKHAVKINFQENYSGSISTYFVIYPKATSLSKISAKSKGFTVKWKKQISQVTGYQIQYSTNKSFSSQTTKTVTKNSTTSATYKGLKPNKKYYVRIRTYKTVSGEKFYSTWSKVKTVKTKK